MTAYTSSQTGNWSAASTWGNAGVPGNGDTCTIASGHTVTADSNLTVGASPAAGAGTQAILVNGTGSLVIGTGLKLTCRGDLFLNNAALTMNAGSTLEFDASAASVPSTAIYNLQIGTGHNQTSARLTVNGTQGNPCKIQSNAGGANARITDASFLQGGLATATWCTFLRIGDSTHSAWQCAITSTCTFSLTNCTFDSGGQFNTTYNIADGTTFTFGPVIFKNTASTVCGQINSPSGISSGSRTIGANSGTLSVFDKQLQIYGPGGFTIQNTLFDGAYDITHPLPWISMDSCLIRGGHDLSCYGPITNTYFLNDVQTDNPHFWTPAATTTQVLSWTSCIFEAPNTLDTSDAGDCITAPSPTATTSYTIANCIVLPAANGMSSGILMSCLGNANFQFSCNHNTWAMTANDPTTNKPALGSVGETFNAVAGQITSFKSNIAYAPSALNGYLFRNINGSPNTDVVSAANADYNNTFNLLAGSALKGYNAPFSGSPGAHDLALNPNFVDATRNMAKWSTSLAGAGTYTDALAQLRAQTAGYTVSALLAYIRGGFAPQNQSLKGAAHDGGDIGAVAVAVPVGVKGSLMMLGIGI